MGANNLMCYVPLEAGPHSCVQNTGIQWQYAPWCTTWDIPLGIGGKSGKRSTKHVFGQNNFCLTNYTHIFMPRQLNL